MSEPQRTKPHKVKVEISESDGSASGFRTYTLYADTREELDVQLRQFKFDLSKTISYEIYVLVDFGTVRPSLISLSPNLPSERDEWSPETPNH